MYKFLMQAFLCLTVVDLSAQQHFSGLHGYQLIRPQRDYYKTTKPARIPSRISQPTGVTNPFVEWEKCYGGNNDDVSNCVQLTLDGGFIVAGFTTSQEGDVMGYHGTGNNGDVWVVKMDNKGNIQWRKCFGGTDSEQGAYILPTSDGGYILTAAAASQNCNISGNHGGFDYWVVKLDKNGNIIWQKMYGGSKEDFPTAIAAAPDGGYFVTGHTLSNDGDVSGNHGETDYWIIKIDAAGTLIWQKCLGGADYDFSTSIQATPDGGCVSAGTTNSSNGDITGFHGAGDYWVVKLDKLGNLQWQKTYGGSYTENAFNIQITNDGGYLVSGFSNSFDGDVSGNHGDGFDAWLVKLGKTGVIQWQKCYGGSQNEVAYFAQLTSDGGYVVAGSARSSDGDLSCNAGMTDAWIFKITGNGDLEWQKDFGGNDFDEAYCIQPLSDGSFITAGYVNSSDISGYHAPTANYLVGISDYWVVKLSAPVASPPNPVVTIDPLSATACAGGSSTIKADVLSGGLNPTYQWTKNGLPVGTNSAMYTASDFSKNDQITCSVTSSGPVCNNYLLQGKDAVSIKVNENTVNPSISISTNNPFNCGCTDIIFKATVTNAGGSPAFQWQVNGQNTGIDADVFVSNILNAGDMVTCIYSDNASCLANGSVTSNSIHIGIYDGGPPSVNIAASSDTVCSGSSITFTATTLNAGTNPAYQWKLNGINTGSNSNIFSATSVVNGDVVTCVIKTDPDFSCAPPGVSATSNEVVMDVINKALPSVTVNTASDTVCIGVPVVFTANTSNAGTNPVYQWKINGVSVGTNSNNFITSSLSDKDVITCTVTVDPSFTCSLNNSVMSENKTMTVKNVLAPTVSVSASANEICKGDTVIFKATVENTGASPLYNWILNNSMIDDHSNNLSMSTLSDSDQLYCQVVPDGTACSSSSVSSNIIVAIVNPIPVVNIFPSDTTINYGNAVELRATTSAGVISFQWSPGVRLTNSLALSTSTLPLTENTIFHFIAQNDKGCKASATSVVNIFNALVMPNAFTPNGDALNDVFRIPPDITLKLKQFSIYNQWGQLVFTTDNVGRGWDGTFKGVKQNAGIYVYYIKGSDSKGNIFFKGSFVLIR
jgi:gliding motility-associated-like protein